MSVGHQPGVGGSATANPSDLTNGAEKLGAPLMIVTADDSSPIVLHAGWGQIAERAAKRAVDIALSAIGLLLAAPLMAILAAVIRIDSVGPVIYRQIRVGRNGRHFELVKLRTMREGTRVTRVGRILRPLGLDELPQFWNVLLGHMSVVGPRPERPHLVDEYESKLPGYAWRHAVRPGITGWAQIHGLRGGARSIAERLHFDLEYLRSWNLVLDFRILARTVTAVWRDTRRELGS